MRSIRLLSILLAAASCTDRQSNDQVRDGANKSESERSAVKMPPIDRERQARVMAATRTAYAASKDRKDRFFGTAFEDVWWEQPLAGNIKRISTGDMFRSYDYNGGDPSYFMLRHGDQLLTSQYKRLYVDEHPYESIIVVGPARNYGQPARRWTADELRLIASFFLTRTEVIRKRDIASEREHGFHETADAHEQRPMMKLSVVFDDQGLIASPSWR